MAGSRILRRPDLRWSPCTALRMSSATRGPAARVPAGRFAARPHRRRRTAICRKWQGLWRPAPSISPRFGRRTWVAGCRPARDRRRAAVTAFRASRSARIAIICRHSPAPSGIAAVGNSCLGSRALRSPGIPIRPSGLQRRRRSLGAGQSCLWPYRGAAASSDSRRRAKGLGSERSSRTRLRCGPKKEQQQPRRMQAFIALSSRCSAGKLRP